MGLMLNERCNADEIAKKMTFRDACAAHESDGIKALRLASWEATVLPLLRRAMAERPELRDARVKLEREGKDATFEVKLHGGDWDRTANIRRSRFADIAADCAALAEAAAAEVAKLRAVCLECVEWNGAPRSGAPCGTCGSIDAAARAAMLDAIEREIEGEAASVSNADIVVPLNPGRIDTHNDKPAPPAIHNALVTEAARLGLPCHEKTFTVHRAALGWQVDMDDIERARERDGAPPLRKETR